MIAQVWEVAWLTCLLSQDSWGDCRDSRFPVTLRQEFSLCVHKLCVFVHVQFVCVKCPKKKKTTLY